MRMNKSQLEKLEQAEDILNDVYFQIRDEKGLSKQAKRLDTILSKLYQLKHLSKEH